ncbi:helix-turn-helix domain-containing protein [Chitinophaga flava]|uniref:XRE family transcriptional regulator n=1 Tax=Chitinophaga flava TaxID=2259036 RepID=A0A365XQH2_9BACT|nr:XRE family transcriptional regulator [Chitinophaga flava]
MIGVRNQDLSKRFGERFRKLREATGLSTREFADTAGIAYSQVWSIESGKGNPTLSTMEAIARALGTDISGLMKDL